MKTPKFLKKGDKIGIVSPAKFIPNDINNAIDLLQSWGLEPVIGASVSAQFHQFAGNDALRTSDMQQMLDDQSISAIIAARGGYGSVRIIDQLDFSKFIKHPKWLVGFSDITVFHNHINQNFNIATIHGQMPISIPESKPIAVETLRKALFGETLSYEFEAHPLSSTKTAEGTLIGGNLSILISMMNSVSELDYSDKILFIEDVGEHYYTIDRMLRTLYRAHKLAHLRGLLVGNFTAMKDDNNTPFGFSVPEIIHEITKNYTYPVYYNFPAGHQANNQALVFGKKVSICSQNGTLAMTYKNL